MTKVSVALIVLLGVACTSSEQGSQVGEAPARSRGRPGDTVRIVRFIVNAGMQSQFEDFFWSSLKPAAAAMASVDDDPVGSFRLLIPESSNDDGSYTYYVLVDPVSDDAPTGEAMRDMVRSAFPGGEGELRVDRWMRSIRLGDVAPVGQDFIEADLRGTESRN